MSGPFIIIDKKPGSGSGKISISNAGEAVEIWTVQANGFNYGTEAVRGSGIFPEVYTTYHAINPRLRLMPIDVQQDDERPDLFICTLTWTSDKLDPKKEQDDRDQEEEPLDRIAKITVETQFAKEAKHRDAYGSARVNAAGDLCDPPTESNACYVVIKITKNVTVFPDWVFDFANVVNSAPFTIKERSFDTGTCWLAYVKLGSIQYSGPTPWCEASLEIWYKRKREARPGYTVPEVPAGDAILPAGAAMQTVAAEDPASIPDPWDTEQLNEGLYKLKGGDPKQRMRCQVKDDAGLATNAVSPVPLKLDGDQLYPVTIDNATYLVFHDHKRADLNDIAYLWSDA
jgi:hypothetical protein